MTKLRNRCLELVTAPAEGKLPIELRADAADALGLIGDPRFDPSRWHLPAKRMLSKEEEPIPGFVRIAAGEFMMGNKREKNNLPRKVCIENPFYIARYATTVAQFRHFVDEGGYEEKQWWDDDGLLWLSGEYDKQVHDEEHRGRLRDRPLPERCAPASWAHQLQSPSSAVVGVSWFEARAYARWLDRSLHQTSNDASISAHVVLLPTEPQWERVAHWVANENGYDERRWPWGNQSVGAARHANVDHSLGRTASVGLYEPTGPGLFDMAGNAREWMDNPYSPAIAERFGRAPRNHLWRGSESHFVRGGSWFDPPEDASCSYREAIHPDGWYDGIGFRVVWCLAENEA